ncbi:MULTISPECIES: DUF4142 domain-containing protein [Olivibacter]|uniref:DUF4142 domain-containing protein n=1 Tax=Olivibacter jilunii TaxID=985016 RepID=A0ABW6B4Z5_9SPHI|nr:DUF4142 domain-containing protein [Pseudosphingobacterium sp.]
MKKYLIFAFVYLTISHFVLSCSDDDDTNPVMMDNQTFVSTAASSNQFEIMAGAQAVEKGSAEAVRSYGELMVNDHGKAGEELKAIAETQGFTVPMELAAKEKANLDQLTPLTGEAFDKAFAQIMVKSHEDAVLLFSEAASQSGVPNSALRTWANEKLPTLEAHLEDAKALNTQINP